MFGVIGRADALVQERIKEPAVVEPGQGEQVRSLEVMGCEGVHRVAASGKQAPGQGPWPGELTSASYGFRWMRGTASMAMMRTMGGSLR